MPFRDPERERLSAIERKKRYRAKKHAERFGPDAGDQRGKGKKATGREHYRWNKGRMLSEHGYVKVRVGVEHPLSDPNGYAYEHLLVWCSAGNQRPADGEALHHKNEDKTDNRYDNLALMQRGDHNALHIAERGRRSNGQFETAAGRILDGRTWDEFAHKKMEPEVADA